MERGEEICRNILFISSIPKNTSKEELQYFLESCGDLNSLNIIYKSDFAYAFAEFDDMRDAAHAMQTLNKKEFKGMPIKLEFKILKNQSQSQKNHKKSEKQNLISTRTSISSKSDGKLFQVQSKEGKKEKINERQRKQRQDSARRGSSRSYSRSREKKRKSYTKSSSKEKDVNSISVHRDAFQNLIGLVVSLQKSVLRLQRRFEEIYDCVHENRK